MDDHVSFLMSYCKLTSLRESTATRDTEESARQWAKVWQSRQEPRAPGRMIWDMMQSWDRLIENVDAGISLYCSSPASLSLMTFPALCQGTGQCFVIIKINTCATFVLYSSTHRYNKCTRCSL